MTHAAPNPRVLICATLALALTIISTYTLAEGIYGAQARRGVVTVEQIKDAPSRDGMQLAQVG